MSIGISGAGFAQETAPEGEAAPAEAAPVEATEAAPAEEEASPELAPRLTDQSVGMEEFVLQLIPLTGDELAALTDEWLAIVKAATVDLVQVQIAATSEDETVAEAAREALPEQTEARNELFSRYSAVLDNWEKKGGDPAVIASYRAYRNAIIVEEKRNADWRTLLNAAVAWSTSPEGGLKLALNAAIVVGAFLGLLIVARIVRRIASRAIGRVPNLSKLLQSFIVFVIYWLTVAFGLMIVLSALGMDVTPLFALVGGASFILAFAMQDTLGNLAAGLMIMINRPFDEGDYVDIGGVGGTVQSVSIVSTKVITPDNQVIVVPNSKVWGNVITNVTASDTRRVDMMFGIGYGDSIEDAQQVLEATVTGHPLVLDDPAPVIRVNNLGASSVDFIVRPWVNRDDYWTVYWDLQRQVKEAFDAAGISIPFPQTDMHVHVSEARTGALPFVPAGAIPAAASDTAGYSRNDDGPDGDR
jgi:small conductance mechanosensitive channel